MLQIHSTKGGKVTAIPGGYRLSIPGTRARYYLLAQLDDYTKYSRPQFPHRYSSIRLEARVSSSDLPGTWGFGLWNDPFGLNLGFTGSSLRLPALPNAAWFFNASPHNHLSFQDNKPAQGFLAQCFQSPTWDWKLAWIALLLVINRRSARRMLGSIIQEDSAIVALDVTQWNTFELNWGNEGTKFMANKAVVLNTPISPKAPLGVVIWMDNQFAAFSPSGKIGIGILDHPEPSWLEIRGLELQDPPFNP